VDLLHAHPFQSFDHLDVALVHNGQITNYWKSRERLERRGFKFQTNNDSELIVHYIIEKLNEGEGSRTRLRRPWLTLTGLSRTSCPPAPRSAWSETS